MRVNDMKDMSVVSGKASAWCCQPWALGVDQTEAPAPFSCPSRGLHATPFVALDNSVHSPTIPRLTSPPTVVATQTRFVATQAATRHTLDPRHTVNLQRLHMYSESTNYN
jgi:hypothetical protein